ncbi:S1 RNA-binding domain-containing protein [ANME-2 cluster archaeon]|nr:MAG: S1 RNA-binding domain-containing protein [ANME-2 cluster archaeon]
MHPYQCSMALCKACDGRGFIITEENECSSCKGTGKARSINLSELSEKQLSQALDGSCPVCNGTGIVRVTEKCQECNGYGEIKECRICGSSFSGDGDLCEKCAEKPSVCLLSNLCDVHDLRVGAIYEGSVSGVVDFGAFVDLNKKVRGLVHSSNLISEVNVGDTVHVQIKNIKPNGNIELIPKKLRECQIVEVERDFPGCTSSELSAHIGETMSVAGRVVQVKQTAGPTIFTILDRSGTVACAAFERAGERAYPEIDRGAIVNVIGDVSLRNQDIQIEVAAMKRMLGSEAARIEGQIEDALEVISEPHNVDLLIESHVLSALKDGMLAVAKRIRRAVFSSQPIVLRHHADADGMTAAIALERAILPLIREVGGTDAEYHFYRRSPSKAPFYEMIDIVRDMCFALDDQARHGQDLPLVVLVDNGSTEEDVPAFKHTAVYGIDVVVVDHHHPDAVVDQYLCEHVNPYHVGGDFGVTAGMICGEIARMINPEVTEEIKHLPAVAALGDRSAAVEARGYIDLVSDQYTVSDLSDIALALDYAAFWLKFQDGRGLVNDILNFGKLDRHRKLVKLLCEQARSAIDDQLKVCMPHVLTQKLPNGVSLNVIDLEHFAHKFTFPPPGKTSGEIHDLICQGTDDSVVTIGYGPDFAVIRSRGVAMNIPQMVRELHDELDGAGVSGGGHLVVGSIKFVEGMRKEVLQRLAQMIGGLEIA